MKPLNPEPDTLSPTKTAPDRSLIEPYYESFRKLGLPYFGVLIIRILLFRVLYQDPLFSETPLWSLD